VTEYLLISDSSHKDANSFSCYLSLAKGSDATAMVEQPT